MRRFLNTLSNAFALAILVFVAWAMWITTPTGFGG